MAFGEFLDKLGVNVGGQGSVFTTSFVVDIVIFLVLCVGVGVFAYWYANKKAYNKTVVKFRVINGITRRIGTEKAREVVLPNTSVRGFFLKGSKFYLPRPSIETGQNEYWFFIREDGEWINIGVENLNKTLKELKLKYDHTDMRMANAALKRLVDKNYKKVNWLKEYAPYIGFALIILMLGVAGYLVMSESAKVTSAAAGNVQSLAEIAETMNNILVSLDNIGSNSGVMKLK